MGRILATGSDIDEDDMEMDPVRRRILPRVKESRSNLRMASRTIGRNAAYLHQFIHRGTPRVLAENDREALDGHVDCSPEELGHDRSPSGDLLPQPPLAVPGGYCAVREIDVQAAAGPGALNEEAERTKAIWILGERLIRHEFQATPVQGNLHFAGSVETAEEIGTLRCIHRRRAWLCRWRTHCPEGVWTGSGVHCAPFERSGCGPPEGAHGSRQCRRSYSRQPLG